VRLEGLSKLKEKIRLIGTRTRDLPACSIVPQPTTLPSTPNINRTTANVQKVSNCIIVNNNLMMFLTVIQYDFLELVNELAGKNAECLRKNDHILTLL
jgi:hypothetical protein